MSTNKPPPPAPPPVTNKPEGVPPAHPSGRAKFDARGNAVWEWQTESGEFSTDVSTQRIKKLEAPELSLEITARIKKSGATNKDTIQGGGFNPYDHGAPNTAKNPDTKKPSAPPAKSVTEPRKPVKDLKRLQEWMDMKKRLADQSNDD